MELKKEDYEHLIELALIEDLRDGDITSEAMLSRGSISTAKLIAKQDGVICGIEVFCDVMLEVDPILKIDRYFKDGDCVKFGDEILRIHGKTMSILKAERSALNFMQRMSGIATKTKKYSEMIRQFKTEILDTRKTIPAFRLLDKYSVLTGGGTNHRMGLYDMFLIKENHIRAVGDEISVAVTKARNYKIKGAKIEVETTNLEEVKEACLSNADVVMLDNMNDELVKEALSIINEYNAKHNTDIKSEASGNITEERLLSLAQLGVDYISMGELTHSVKAFDLSLLILE